MSVKYDVFGWFSEFCSQKNASVSLPKMSKVFVAKHWRYWVFFSFIFLGAWKLKTTSGTKSRSGWCCNTYMQIRFMVMGALGAIMKLCPHPSPSYSGKKIPNLTSPPKKPQKPNKTQTTKNWNRAWIAVEAKALTEMVGICIRVRDSGLSLSIGWCSQEKQKNTALIKLFFSQVPTNWKMCHNLHAYKISVCFGACIGFQRNS